MMLAHRLRHRVTFQRSQVAKAGDGWRDTEWPVAVLPDGTVLEDVPAEVLTGAGREAVSSGSVQATVDARVNLRWFPVDPRELCAWRLVWGDQIYSIIGAEVDATGRREWRLRCVYGQQEGA